MHYSFEIEFYLFILIAAICNVSQSIYTIQFAMISLHTEQCTVKSFVFEFELIQMTYTNEKKNYEMKPYIFTFNQNYENVAILLKQ